VSRVVVDTSALLALLVPSNRAHPAAKRAFARLRARDAVLLTTSYVLLETYSLLGRRFGRAAVATFREGLAPLLDVVWVDEALHEAGLDLITAEKVAGLSLTDAVLLAAARSLEVDDVFAFDPHLEAAGLHPVR
jgi:predicted nucleic acid-binding protein